MERIKHRIPNIFFMISPILYERGRERISLILEFLVLASLKLIKPLVSLKIKERIKEYHLSFIRRKILRHPAVLLNTKKQTIGVCITYRCNASCEFCYAGGLQNEFPQDMSLDDFVYLIRWAKAKGWRRLLFLGGEPTIHPQFEEMLNICYSQGIPVSLSTNAFFGGRVLEKLKYPYVELVAVNYRYGDIPSIHRRQFLYNLKSLSKEKFPLLLAGILDGETDRWKKIVEMAVRLKSIIDWCFPLPTYTRKPFEDKILSKLKASGLQILEILKTCSEKKVLCYVCRPVPACIFTPEQWQQVKKMGRYLVFTRCFHGYRGDYTINLTVNPDLSIYPCSNFFIKGPHISFFKDRASISKYYERGIVKNIMKIPPMIECSNCRLYQNYLSLIESKSNLIKKQLCDENVCQAGCAVFRIYRNITSSCLRSIE